jgi:hypothetical protein
MIQIGEMATSAITAHFLATVFSHVEIGFRCFS